NIERVYHILLIVLAPMSVISGAYILRMVSFKRLKKKHIAILLTILLFVPFFLFQTEFVYSVTGSSVDSIQLSKTTYSVTIYKYGFFSNPDISGVLWLTNYRNSSSNIYADDTSISGVLQSYGMVNVDKTDMIPITRTSSYSSGDLAYLTGEDTVVGSIISSGGTYNLSQVLTPLN